MSSISHTADTAGNFETQARSLAMRPQVCWRPNTTITGSLIRISKLGLKPTLRLSVQGYVLSLATQSFALKMDHEFDHLLPHELA